MSYLYDPQYSSATGYPSGGYELPYGWRPRENPLMESCSELAEANLIGPGDGSHLETLLHLAHTHGSRDAFVWGPQLVRAVLSGDDPRHGLRSLEERQALVRVLRRVIEHGHERRNIDPQWRLLTSAALEEARATYLAGAPTEAELKRRRCLDNLAELVGGVEALASLDREPVPAEALDLSEVPVDIHERVRFIDGLVVAGLTADGVDEPELLTIAHRLLRRAARLDPALFRRKSRDQTIASGLVVLAVESNGRGQDPGLTRRDVARRLNVAGGANQRSVSLLRSACVRQHTVSYEFRQGLPEHLQRRWAGLGELLCAPALQTGAVRGLIIESHEALVERGRLERSTPTDTTSQETEQAVGESSEAVQTEPVQAEPAETEPVQAEPGETDPAEPEGAEAEVPVTDADPGSTGVDCFQSAEESDPAAAEPENQTPPRGTRARASRPKATTESAA